MRRGLIVASNPLQQIRAHQMKIAVVRLKLQGRFHVRERCVEFGLPTQRIAKVHVRFRMLWIELDRDLILFDCFVQLAFLLQRQAIIKMRFCADGYVRDEPSTPLYLRHVEMCLPKPERAQRDNEHQRPFQAVPCPARKHTAERYISSSTSEPERLARGTLANFPDKSVVVKMQQCGSGHHAGKDAFDRVDPEMRIDEGKRAVGENESDIKSNQRSAPSEDEPHKSANVPVFLDTVAIVNPDERQVLHVVENFEQRDPDENV